MLRSFSYAVKLINALNSTGIVYEVKYDIFVLAIGLLIVEGFVEIFTLYSNMSVLSSLF